MQKVRCDAAPRDAEDREGGQIRGFDAERKIRMRYERKRDRVPFFHPAPRHSEVIRKLIERCRRRLRSNQSREKNQREGEKDKWRTGHDACPKRQGQQSDASEDADDRHHRPWRDVNERDQKADRAEDRIADHEI